MIRMENSSAQSCWIPTATETGNTGKQGIQYSQQQTLYNGQQCSVAYNIPTITLPPNPTQTYIVQDHQPAAIQTQIFQQNGTVKTEDSYLKCRHWPGCKFYTSSPQQLKNHELTHYAQGNLYTCTDCNIHFTNRSSKDEHTRRKHKTWAKVYSCSHCNYETTVLDEFSDHNVAFHLEAGTTGQIYQCPQCPYSTSWKCFMDTHLLIHSVNELDYRLNKKSKVGEGEKQGGEEGGVGGPGGPGGTGGIPISSTAGPPPVLTQLTTPTASSSPSSASLSSAPCPASSGGAVVSTYYTSSAAPTLLLTTQATQPAQAAHTQQPLQITSQPLQMTSQPLQMTSQAIQMTSQPLQMTSQPLQMTSQPIQMSSQQVQMATQPAQILIAHPQAQPRTMLMKPVLGKSQCTQCGYTTDNITDLSLHVCAAYQQAATGYPQLTYFDQTYQQPQQQPQQQQQQQQQPQQPPAPVVNTTTTATTGGNSKKRPNRAVVDDDFQEGIYRCRKCNYGTSWKCFLDSHMLTHGGVN